MGCDSSVQPASMPISSSLVALMIAGKSEEAVEYIKRANFRGEMVINYRRESLWEFAMRKGDTKVMDYLRAIIGNGNEGKYIE